MKPPSVEEAAALALVPLVLTADESKLLQHYRATAPYWRTDIIDYANMVAKMFPLERESAAPDRIKLVAGSESVQTEPPAGGEL